MKGKTNAWIRELEPRRIVGEGKDADEIEEHLGTRTIYLPFLPDEIVFDRQTRYTREPLAFTSENILLYEGTSALDFKLEWQWVVGVDPLALTPTELMEYSSLVHSLSMPNGTLYEGMDLEDIDESGKYSPPNCVWVHIGEWFDQRCVVLQVELRYGGPWGAKNIPSFGNFIEFQSINTPQGRKDLPVFGSPLDILPEVQNGDLMPMVVSCLVSFEMTQFYDPSKGPSGLSAPSLISKMPQDNLINRTYMRERGLGITKFPKFKS